MSDHDPSYWPRLCELLRNTAASPATFVDAGANHGDFTAQLLAEFAGCAVHAVEPNEALVREIGSRFGGQAVEPNQALVREIGSRFAGQAVRVWHAALHDHEGSIELQVHENTGTSSVLPRPAKGRRYFHSADRVVATVPVPCMTLDRLAAEAGIGKIDLLKLDTQGAELPILRGAAGLLAAAAIDAIYTEFFVVPHYEGAAGLHELWAALDRHGYVLYDLFKGPYGRNGQLRFGDALFVSPRVREAYLDTFPDEA